MSISDSFMPIFEVLVTVFVVIRSLGLIRGFLL